MPCSQDCPTALSATTCTSSMFQPPKLIEPSLLRLHSMTVGDTPAAWAEMSISISVQAVSFRFPLVGLTYTCVPLTRMRAWSCSESCTLSQRLKHNVGCAQLVRLMDNEHSQFSSL